jgi:sterol desaturase/sphingolipid hydroxylase (fatty acid hydroxylase superfamily)
MTVSVLAWMLWTPDLMTLNGRSLLIAGVGAVVGFVLSSLVEYWVHRWMHKPGKFGERHRDHHRRNEGQGVVWEFRDYVKGASIAMLLPLAICPPLGLGWLLGSLGFAAFSAYAHQLQHENPIKCFWMAMPVHYVHHKYNMWQHNFGLAVDWWDHVFGTYKLVDWKTETELSKADLGYHQLRWW